MKRTAFFLPLLLCLWTGCIHIASEDQVKEVTEATESVDTGFVEVFASSQEKPETALDSLEVIIPEGEVPSGTVAYTLEINLKAELEKGLKGQQKALAAFLPDKMEQASKLTFLGTVGRVSGDDTAPTGGGSVQMQTMGTDMLIDLESGLEIGLTNLGDGLYAVKEKSDPAPAKVLEETKEILGYTCKKAEIQIDSNTGTAWYTEEIPYGFSPLGDLGTPGLVLEAESPKMKIIATKVLLGPVDRSNFELDPALKYVTAQQLKDITEEMMGQFGGATIIK